MKFPTMRGGGAETSAIEFERKLRAARVEAVRQTRWTELEESHLVARGPRGAWLVHEPTDAIYVARRGSVFVHGRAVIEFASPEDQNAAFYVTSDEQVVVLERLRSPASWSEYVERQARRAARTRTL